MPQMQVSSLRTSYRLSGSTVAIGVQPVLFIIKERCKTSPSQNISIRIIRQPDYTLINRENSSELRLLWQRRAGDSR